jgi:hypothetical protein
MISKQDPPKNNFLKSVPRVIGLVFIVGIIVLTIPSLIGMVKTNFNAISALRSTYSMDPSVQAQALNLIREQAFNDQRVNWLLAQIATNQEEKQNAYRAVLYCCSEYVNLLSAKMNSDIGLATEATQVYPENPQTWLWLANLQSKTNPNLALDAYTQVVRLDDHNGLVWCYIGRITEKKSLFQQAENAYLKCCQNEDPGVEGCYGAGRMAEKLGDPQRAISYYRLSKWSTAQSKADELEKNQQP